MSRPEETILKIQSAFGLRQKGDKKYNFNPPAGTLVLTDKRLIFAQSGGEFAKRLLAGGLLGGIIGSEMLSAMTRVKAEELDKALERSESFQVNLQDISEVKTERKLGAFLSVQWNTPEKTSKALLYKTGMISGFQGFDDWVKAIQDAKIQYKTQKTPTSLSESTDKFCIGCGQKIPENGKFCPECGSEQ